MRLKQAGAAFSFVAALAACTSQEKPTISPIHGEISSTIGECPNGSYLKLRKVSEYVLDATCISKSSNDITAPSPSSNFQPDSIRPFFYDDFVSKKARFGSSVLSTTVNCISIKQHGNDQVFRVTKKTGGNCGKQPLDFRSSLEELAQLKKGGDAIGN